MHNYGDLLFPLIAQFRLSSFGYNIVSVAPTNIKTKFADALPPISIAEFLTLPLDISGILIGGGYMIHTKNLNVPEVFQEYANRGLSENVSSELWIGASLLSKKLNLPVLWNAPGVPFFLHRSQSQQVSEALKASKYINVRDEGSAEILRKNCGIEPKVVPDTALDIGRMWPKPSLLDTFKNLLNRKKIEGNNFLHIHIRNRSLSHFSYSDLAEKIEFLAKKYRLIPILNGIGESHNDHIEARLISKYLHIQHLLLDDPTSLQEIAASIAFSNIYIGASMHGYISAIAYGIPGVLVAKPAYKKFSGIIGHLQREDDLAEDWGQAFLISDAYLNYNKEEIKIPQKVYCSLDEHWNQIVNLLP